MPVLDFFADVCSFAEKGEENVKCLQEAIRKATEVKKPRLWTDRDKKVHSFYVYDTAMDVLARRIKNMDPDEIDYDHEYNMIINNPARRNLSLELKKKSAEDFVKKHLNFMQGIEEESPVVSVENTPEKERPDSPEPVKLAISPATDIEIKSRKRRLENMMEPYDAKKLRRQLKRKHKKQTVGEDASSENTEIESPERYRRRH